MQHTPGWFGMSAVDMWRPLGCADSERFALVWESEELKALNNTLFSFVKNKVGHAHLLAGGQLDQKVRGVGSG